MKKLVAVMLLGIAILGTTSAQNLKSDGLQGKVHTLEEETWGLTLMFGEYVKNKLLNKTISIYDAKGNDTEWASYYPDGSLFSKEIYTYDDKGNMTERASYKADGSLAWKDIYTYEYDKFGNWTKKIISAEVSKFGKVYLELQGVTIRTITYYP